MVNVDKSVIARYHRGHKGIEVLVDCEKAIELRQGKDIAMEDVLAFPDVFTDSSRGLKASDSDLQELLGTNDRMEAARRIIKEGEVQLTTEHRKHLREEKHKQLLELLHRNYIDPRTNAPHPFTRLENAMAEARLHLDEFKSVEDQLDAVVKKLQPIIPLKFERKHLSVRIPAQYAAKCFSTLRGHGSVKEEWQNDGSLIAELELPAGIVDDFLDKLNHQTHGDIDVKMK
ncbi:ribosome assembly factor SBDS [Candidatus Woesearchaeota archaeon CG_4_10_14_0_2_um_filter_57_5]|nr:MAG: rRNA metabolism protein [Candidatus Woesearchaeota archaeon CG1_02_57_44]PIN68585.1 MAG: ribosome assembly factor SBDS [Candidatus Woesearchaeota archaeon CG11_big_fil_rev_8_21_14_0_20_57_5]PIZ48735.1 MAG: ribosome assembly factor SBDS [Candidatus Woesearchaeota archaeon CG_4_10_14_0_2_um_filter_57_5]